MLLVGASFELGLHPQPIQFLLVEIFSELFLRLVKVYLLSLLLLPLAYFHYLLQ